MLMEIVEALLIIVLAYVSYVEYVEIAKLKRSKGSMSSLYGKTMEEFAPFMKKYKHDPKKFRFIGSPIDGIQFDDDKIVFVEFKASSSKLSDVQRKIRDLVKQKKVYFEEFRME